MRCDNVAGIFDRDNCAILLFIIVILMIFNDF